jgi:hypothetical protein
LSKLSLNRRILIVGEGRETEYNYFVGFRTAFEDFLKATATSVSVKRGRGGDACGIVRNAIKEAEKFEPDHKCGDRVFLLLDVEGTGNVPGRGRAPELPAAEKLAAENEIEIVYSAPSFEYWLLCHFAKASRGHFADCDAVISMLNKNGAMSAKMRITKRTLMCLSGSSSCSKPRARKPLVSTFTTSLCRDLRAAPIHLPKFTNSSRF